MPPLYDFEVLDESGAPTGEVFEEIVAAGVTTLTSSTGRVARRKAVQFVAATPMRWGESRAEFNRGLGCMVNGPHHADQIARAKGLRPVEGTLEDQQDRIAREYRHRQIRDGWAQDLETLTAEHGETKAMELWEPERLMRAGEKISDPNHPIYDK